jgi:uncharacterized NAD(P)/FAD-binding protein YdhS/trehalose-6-phosphate synthase
MPKQNQNTFDVVIIGAGFSGAMTAVHLARLAPELRVLLCDKEGAFARGVAYGTRMRGHLLNVPAGKMSAFADEPDHFFNWLESRADELRKTGITEISRNAFLPRQIYGSYLRDVLADAKLNASGLEISAMEIVDIQPENDALVFQSSDEGDSGAAQIRARRVVLAMGNFPPGDPPTRDRSFHRHSRYINSPWSAERLRQVSEDDDVLILGSGLTTLDLLVTLDANKTRGAIHVISRRGLFPQPHKKIAPRPDWFDARRKNFPNTIRALVRFVRAEIKRAAANDHDWRTIVDALRPHTQKIWQSLSVPERRRFMRHVRPFWESHRHRAAPDVLAVKDKMLARGQVIFHKARVTKIREAPDGLEVSFYDRDAKREETIHVRYAVNCTGPECNYHKLKQPLVVNLLARGLIHPDPLFLGLYTAPNGAVVNYLGQPSERIFTLGSLKRGMLFETTAVPELRVQARELAEELLKGFHGTHEKISVPPHVAKRASVEKRSGDFFREEKTNGNGDNLVIISNRGPNDFVWQDEQWVPRSSSGGLVSMIAPLARSSDVTWFCCVSEPPDASDARTALYTTAADQTAESEMHIVPVPMPARIYNAYYGAISNEVLWMLQHHLVGRFGYSSLDAERHRAWREGYLEANCRMLKAIRASGIKPRAFLIQDYHLYPLPALLRQEFPDVPSLHFTHIPFPDPATWKLIPRDWRDAILHGLLGADVVGMQTLWDAHPFLGCCEELLGAQVDYKNSTVLADDGRTVKVRAFPASTDPDEVRETLRSPVVAEARKRLAPDLTDLSIVRVDRLDPSKNQVIGFEAFGRLLELRPDLRGRVHFLAFLVPSRTDLSVYRAYRDAVYTSIENVNARFTSDCGFPPIKVFYTNNREQALVAMERCDALLVNSREDGMNLVVKEWALVSQRPGVAIISETAGVAVDLGEDALLVCPLDIEGTAHAMSCALDMECGERTRRIESLRKKIAHWTAADWLSHQLTELGIAPASEKSTKPAGS